jgi:hypothetical protein
MLADTLFLGIVGYRMKAVQMVVVFAYVVYYFVESGDPGTALKSFDTTVIKPTDCATFATTKNYKLAKTDVCLDSSAKTKGACRVSQ